MPYVTELPDSFATLNGDLWAVDFGDNVNVLNLNNQSEEFSQYDIDSDTGDTLSNGDNIATVDAEGNTTTSGTYLGDVTISTASVDVGLGDLVNVGVTLNPIEGELMVDENGQLHALTEDEVSDDHLGVQLSVTIAGQTFEVGGDNLSDAIDGVGDALPFPLNLTWNAVAGTAADVVQAGLDTAVVTMEYDDTGTLDLTDDQVVPCFCAGTLIQTQNGQIAVEELSVGDNVLTSSGTAVEVKWVGRKSVRNNRLDDRHLPVCISAGALGGGLPHSDLYVSADHGMIIDEMVMNAGALVNGGSIRFVDVASMPAEFTYFHIETQNHDEILANGAPAETFIDYIDRKSFDNYQEYLDLYGAERIIPEMSRPRISAQRLVPQAIRSRLGIAEAGFDLSERLIA